MLSYRILNMVLANIWLISHWSKCQLQEISDFLRMHHKVRFGRGNQDLNEAINIK